MFLEEVPSHCALCRQHHLVRRERSRSVRLCSERVSEPGHDTVVVNDTQCKPKTAEKYLRIIKNALFLENEEEKRTMLLSGRGEKVQADESCVFSR